MNEIKISIKSNEIEQENIVLLRNKINEINCSFNLSEILNFRKKIILKSNITEKK